MSQQVGERNVRLWASDAEARGWWQENGPRRLRVGFAGCVWWDLWRPLRRPLSIFERRLRQTQERQCQKQSHNHRLFNMIYSSVYICFREMPSRVSNRGIADWHVWHKCLRGSSRSYCWVPSSYTIHHLKKTRSSNPAFCIAGQRLGTS